jgi:putative oxidoreductase
MKKVLFSNSFSKGAFNLGAFILRVGLGALMIPNHGWAKLSGFAEKKDHFISFMGLSAEWSLRLATFAEFFCAILLILGLFTRLAAIPLIIVMLTALGVAHHWDILGHELPFALLTGFIAILLLGPGKYSLDALIYKR